jgi:cysteine desulfurase
MIYLDNHATTRIDPAVIESMCRFMQDHYANPGSTSHEPGREVARFVDSALNRMSSHFGVEHDELVMTSGATESNNLAVFGVALHPKQRRNKVVSVVTEHRALLDPLARLERHGLQVQLLPVRGNAHRNAGVLDLNLVAEAIDEDTALVSVMLANNEIGTIQPLADIAKICQRYDVPLHTDASQAVGRIPVNIDVLGVDLLSFSAHKFYGPKGMGGLIVRNSPKVRLHPQILGGGQQGNLRSGTLNSVGIVGMDLALDLSLKHMHAEMAEQFRLRDLLWKGLNARIDGLILNGPTWSDDDDFESLERLPNNLNVCFPKVEGQSLMLALPDVAMSSGSACTSAEPHPSHVLMSLGMSADEARASLRFGIGRFNTEDEIVRVIDGLARVHAKLASFAA